MLKLRSASFSTNTGRDFSVDVEPSFVREFWSGDVSVFSGGKFTSYIEPHCAKVFALTPLSDTAVIGSDASLVMQSAWDRLEGGIAGKRLKAGEHLYIGAKNPAIFAEGCSLSTLSEKDGYTFYEALLSDDAYTVTF